MYHSSGLGLLEKAILIVGVPILPSLVKMRYFLASNSLNDLEKNISTSNFLGQIELICIGDIQAEIYGASK